MNTTKGGTLTINLDEYKSLGLHCIALYANGNNKTYFDSFEDKNIAKKLKYLWVINI